MEPAFDILFVCGIFPPDIGGPATYVSTLAGKLCQRGRKVAVLTLAGSSTGPSGDFPVIRICRARPRPVRLLLTLWWVLRLGRRSRVIYDNGCPWDTGVVVRLARLILRRPVVLKITGDIPWEYLRRNGIIAEGIDEFQTRPYRLSIRLLRWLQRSIARGADLVITPSHYLKRLVAAWGVPAERIAVVYNSVENESPHGEPAHLGPRSICTVARLVPWKGVGELMECLRELPREVKLYVIGEGPLLGELQERRRALGLVERVVFTGALPRAEVRRHLAAAELFVLNTEYEGLPHAVLEAFQAGVPVLTTEVCGNPEIVREGETGFLVPPGDKAALVRRLQELVSDDGKRRQVVPAAKALAATLNWDRLISETESLMWGLMDRRGQVAKKA